MSIYGTLKTDNALEAQVVATLQGWLPSYITEVARQEGGGAVALPVSFQTVRDPVTRWTEQAMPAIVVQIGGTIAVQRKGASYRAIYGANVGAIIAGPTREDTRRIAGVYALAITAALTQHGDIGGYCDGCEWTDTDYTLIGDAQSRTLMAALVSFDIAVNNVLDVTLGPIGPTPDPTDPPVPGLPNYGDAATVIIDSVTATNGVP